VATFTLEKVADTAAGANNDNLATTIEVEASCAKWNSERGG
jgi:hypothetical protein